jgi:hypothetical protein
MLIFEHKKFSAGTTNKNGDLFLEYYSEENYYDIPNSIFFYGLAKNGRYIFLNESSYTLEKNIEIDEIVDIIGYYNNYEIYDSKNLFVTTKNDNRNQYLFSINSYNSIVELHNFNNNGDKNHYIWEFNDFFNLTEDVIFPYERELYELKGKSLYIMVFIPKILVNENFKGISFIKKFSFKSFDEDAYEEIKSVPFNNYINRIIISSFFMDDGRNFVIVSCNPPGYSFNLIFNLYNQNLQPLNEFTTNFNNFLENNQYKYFKSIYLSNEYVIFAYYCYYCYVWQWHHIYFELYKINPVSGPTKILPKYNPPLSVPIIGNFYVDFIKISDKKIGFMNYNIRDNHEQNLILLSLSI